MLSTEFAKTDSTLTVKLKGKLNTSTAPVLEKALKERLQDITDVIIDFENVTYISSSGIRVLLATDQLMSDKDGSFKLIHVSEEIEEIFELVGFMDMVQVETD